jgi:hypothetical protein
LPSRAAHTLCTYQSSPIFLTSMLSSPTQGEFNAIENLAFRIFRAMLFVGKAENNFPLLVTT